MNRFTLGLSAYQQDAAAALTMDGRPVAAAFESSFSKIAGDAGLPLRAARWCLARGGVTSAELDAVVFHEKPLQTFERALVSSLRTFPRGARSFAGEMSNWLGERLWVKGRLADEFGVEPERVHFVEHLRAHAAAAQACCPAPRSAILVIDDVGEWATTAILRATPDGLEPLMEARAPHSIGLAVSAFAQFLGLVPGKDDAHVQELARLGRPRFASEVRALLGRAGDGSPLIDVRLLRLDPSRKRMWTDAFEDTFGPPRLPGTGWRIVEPDARDADLAASLQCVLEERALELAELARERTGEPLLCFTGALSKNRGVLRALADRQGGALFVPPLPVDASAALGAAFAHGPAQRGLAPGLCGRAHPGPEASPETLADLSRMLLTGSPVALFDGDPEFADESLARRLILADPAVPNAGVRLLAAVQRTEPYLVPRVAVPAECVSDLVDLPRDGLELARAAQLEAAPRGALSDVLGHDQLFRVQAVDRETAPLLHALLIEIGRTRPAPALLVDSFHLRDGVPPRTDTDAYEAFERSSLKAMVLNGELVRSDAGHAEVTLP